MLKKIKAVVLNLKNNRLILFLFSLTLGFGAAIIMVSYAINWEAILERTVELSKSSYLKGCTDELQETNPGSPHFQYCHTKAEFHSADISYIMFQDPKVIIKK